jgi:serine/threonine protein phosphatase 1
MGDIHGGYKALLECLQKVNFDYENDTLIQLGDVCDGWSEVYECVEELLKIKNLIAIRGNHDQWFYEFIRTGIHGSQWTQGAEATRSSYGKRSFMIPESHEKFFGTQLNYYIDDKNRCFVHGGFNRHYPINKQAYQYIYYCDRDLWAQALSHGSMISNPKKYRFKNEFEEIFIGHTTTSHWNKDSKPMNAANVWNLDTGGGFEGYLTIMNVDTKEYWQSTKLKELYPDERGRN